MGVNDDFGLIEPTNVLLFGENNENFYNLTIDIVQSGKDLL